jgi:hypothetical protein
MDYRTNYTITAYKNEDDELYKDIELLYEGLFKEDLRIYDNVLVSSGSDSVKWYDHDIDMTKLSEKYPTVKFVLDGEGEEQGDVWKKIFLGGKMKYLLAELVWPDEDSVEWV